MKHSDVDHSRSETGKIKSSFRNCSHYSGQYEMTDVNNFLNYNIVLSVAELEWSTSGYFIDFFLKCYRILPFSDPEWSIHRCYMNFII